MISFKENQPNQLLINPRWSAAELEIVTKLKDEFNHSVGFENYFLIASSGSSQGLQESVKLIGLHRQAVLNSARRVNHYLQSNSEDKWGLFLPTFHVAGLGIFARACLTGSFVYENKWDLSRLQAMWSELDITLTSLVPAQIYDLTAQKIKAPENLRKVFVGGGALPTDIKNQALSLGWPIVETYGMTETASMIAIKENNDDRFCLLSDVEVAEQNGLLQIRCDSLLTASVQFISGQMRLYRQDDGEFFKTQDRVQIEREEGRTFLKLAGRDYEYIKILGEGVSLSELQHVLEQVMGELGFNPREAVIWHGPDERQGSRLYLIKEKSLSDFNAESVTSLFNQRVKPYERLAEVVSVERLPRSELGKLKIEELKSIIKNMK